MYLSSLTISNFRCFGDGEDSFTLRLKPGLTAIVGQNDAGKTAVVDALRFALVTTDQEWYRLEDEDFHRVAGKTSTQITIQCQFALEPDETGAFVEYLTYGMDGKTAPSLYVNWTAQDTGERRRGRPNRRVEVCSGEKGDGPSFAPEVRELLQATYLKPLRDADQALSAGRGSRLSQVLSSTTQVSNSGIDYNSDIPFAPEKLSVLGIGDLANALLEKQDGVKAARNEVDTRVAPLNEEQKKNFGSIANPSSRERPTKTQARNPSPTIRSTTLSPQPQPKKKQPTSPKRATKSVSAKPSPVILSSTPSHQPPPRKKQPKPDNPSAKSSTMQKTTR